MEEQERHKVTIRLVAGEDLLRDFSDEVSALWRLGSKQELVPVLEAPPTSLAFLRDYVSRSRPCVIKNAILACKSEGEGPDVHQGRSSVPLTLTLAELQALVPPNLPISVDVTPDGHGDCLRQVQGLDRAVDPACSPVLFFVKPLQRRMTFSEFCLRVQAEEVSNDNEGDGETSLARSQQPVSSRIFEATVRDREEGDANAASGSPPDAELVDDGGVVYYSQQNDCLRRELSPLWDLGLFPTGFPWAEEAFRTSELAPPPQPDAVNLWIGNRQSVSSMHKDHYENLFYVLSGEKVFTLCPPCDAPFLYERPFPSGTFEMQSDGEWKVRVDDNVDGDGNAASVHWVAGDVLVANDLLTKDESRCELPLLQYAHPLTVRVRAGELLYLPALWYHHVSQSRETIAINYWYDMNFESPSWCYFRLVQQLQPEVR